VRAGRALALLVLVSCASRPVADKEPGKRPDLSTDEAGLWMQVDRIEADLQTSGKVVDHAALHGYVRSILDRLAPDYAREIRLYIVRAPDFNATMAPNGAMTVWTGLLLRAANESQLAFVLGHELSHYSRRHSLQRWRDIRAKSGGLAFVQVGTAMAGVGYVGAAATVVALGRIYAFSRDNEREADDLGLGRMVAAGYDGREAARIWQALTEEFEAGDEKEPPLFFATHPSKAERVATLTALAAQAAPGPRPAPPSDGRYLDVMAPHWETWLREELAQRRFDRTRVVLDRLAATGRSPGLVAFIRGEALRRRGEEGDLAGAADAYEAALGAGGAPVDTHRSLGIVSLALKRDARARDAFASYLRAAPRAPDRKMVESYLERLR